MKDILIGLVIVLVVFLIGDFIYTEKNTCIRNESGHINEITKCGFLKKELDVNIHIFNRYW